MTRIGDTTTDVLPPCAGADGCSQPVKVVVVSLITTEHWSSSLDTAESLVGQRLIEATTACVDHAPEVVHESRSSMHESEYVILEVP